MYITRQEHMRMKQILVIVVALCWMGFHPFAVAQAETTSETASTPAPEKTEEDTLPDGPEGVLAQVGETKILTQDLITILDKIPYRLSRLKRKELWETNLESMIYSKLLHSYLEDNKAPDAPDQLAALRNILTDEVEKYNQTASLRLLPEITMFELMERKGLTEQRLDDLARYEKLLGTMISNEELLAFMHKHPDYFNDTTVHLGHIMIPCSPLAPTEEQIKAIKTLQDIAADIRAGKISFSEAAHKYSRCPSGQIKGADGTADYGDLGTRTFYELAMMFAAKYKFPVIYKTKSEYAVMYSGMVGVAALDGKVGALSEVIRSPIGFHLIKVLGRTPSDKPRSAESAVIAQMSVLSMVENQIFNQAINRNQDHDRPRVPIIIYKAARKIPKPKKE